MKSAYAQLEEMERQLLASGLDVCIARPTGLTDGPLTGKAVVAKGFTGRATISRADVEFLQENTYDALQVAERSVEGANQDNLNVNIGAVRKVLEDSGVGYAGGVPVFIDVDRVKDKNGNYQGEHFVLQRPGIPGEFYDPWPRAGGKQLIREGGGGVHDIGAYEVYRSSIKDSTLLHLD